jgi:hypothetical protein
MSWVSAFGVEDPLNVEGPMRNTWAWWEQLADDAKDTANEGLDVMRSFLDERRTFFRDQTKLEGALGTGVTAGLEGAADFDNARKASGLKIGSGLKRTLFSPSGQAVDHLVKYGRDLAGGLTDPEGSKPWQELYGSLTEGPLAEIEAGLKNTTRGLAKEAEVAEGEMMDLGASRGSARDPYADKEQVGRLHEAMAGTQAQANTAAAAARAQIKSTANRFMQEYVPKFTADITSFAHNWVFGGGRGQYIMDLGNAVASFTQASLQASAIFSDMGRASLASFTNITTTESAVRAQLFQAANDALAGAISSSVSSVTSMMGGMMG